MTTTPTDPLTVDTPRAVVVRDDTTGLYSALGPYDELRALEVAQHLRRQQVPARGWATVVPIGMPDPQPGDVITWAEPPEGTQLRMAWPEGSDDHASVAERTPEGWAWHDSATGELSRYRFPWHVIAHVALVEQCTVVRWGKP